jgi:hypothetical protein
MDTDSDYDNQVEFCKVVKVNPNYVSEVIEIGLILLKCPESIYDEIVSFLSGKKKVLVEKTMPPKSEKFKKFEVICFDDERYNVFYLRTKLHKLIMSNGNSYYVFVD